MSIALIENSQNSSLSSRSFDDYIDTSSFNLLKEEDRLATFVNNGWANSYVNSEDLARLGFYFFKKHDIVKCIFCYVSIGEFETGDTALREHQKWSPNCPLIRRRSTDNIPINGVLLDQILPPQSYDICGFTKVRRKSKIEEMIKHPEFKLMTQRIKSFETWPVGIKQRPQELAEAGFFYSGQSDLTICFSCDVHLSKWEPFDNAWVEHKKHATEDCDFLKTNHETVKLNEEKFKEVKKPPKVEETSDEASESTQEVQFESLCKICLERKSTVLFLPCKHVSVCGICVFGIEKDCPICRTPIDQTINLYYA
jgi:hypothetical protein